MKIKFIISTLTLLFPLLLSAQEQPTINPHAVYFSDKGEPSEPTTSISGSAPLRVLLTANESHTTGWTAYYEWRITLEGEKVPYLVRYEKDTEVRFTKAGAHRIVLYAIFTQGQDSVKYT